MTNEAFNEIQILKSCAAGDAAAFEAIVHKYQSLVCAITYSAVGQVDKSEELAQQAFINAWKNLAQLQDLDKFRAWLIGITRNVIRTFFRKQKRDIVNNAAPLDAVDQAADSSSEPLEAIITKEQETIVQQSLHQIPEMYREPMVLFYRQQQSTKEVAEALELSEDTVRTRLMRGRKMLKDQVAGMIESTLSHTGPGKAFTTMVVASIAGLALTSATATAASGTATGAATAGTATGLATVMSTITAKVITAAAVVAVGVGAVFTYKHLTNPERFPTQFPDIAANQQEQTLVEDKQVEKTTDIVSSTAIAKNMEVKPSDSLNAKVVLQTDINKSEEEVENSGPTQVTDGFIVGGVVQTEDGKPIAGVDVQLLWDVMRGMPMLDGKDTVTDANGMWQCQITGESEDISIRLKHPEYLSRHYDYRPSFDDLVEQSAILLMNKGLQVSGLVHDLQGNPISNALIMPPRSITRTDAVRGIQDSAKTTRTDANGQFLLKAVGSGLQDIAIDADGYAPAFISVNMTPEMSPIEIILDEGCNLTGVVTDINGKPLSGVKVKIDDWNLRYDEAEHEYRIKQFKMLRRQAVTDIAGQYTIEHLPPVSEVEIIYSQKKSGLLTSYIENDMTQNTTKNVTMFPIPTITGIVVDADSGEPIPEFEVSAGCTWDPNSTKVCNSNRSKVTSLQGHFSKTKSNFCAHELPAPGYMAVRVSAKGYHPAQSPWMQVGQDFSPITIRLEKTRILSSTLFYSDGESVSNANVVMVEPSSWVQVTNGKIDEGFSNSHYRTIQADTNGYFEIPEPSSPTKLIVLDYDEYLVADTNDLPEKLTLIPWAYVTGVVDRDGKSNSNINVQIEPGYDPNKQIRWTSMQTTNVDGQFEFFYIPAIPQTIQCGSNRNERVKINPRPNEELQLRLGNRDANVK